MTFDKNLPPILQIGDVLVTPEIFTETFCCDLEKCHGACCIDGDAGAPVTPEEVMEIEDRLDSIWPMMSASAQSVVDQQGVAYIDREGDLVTSIVNGRDCAFTCHENGCCLCLLQKAPQAPLRGDVPADSEEKSPLRGEKGGFKPISCALYPLREKRFGNGTVGLSYHRWAICAPAREKGKELNLPLYKFLKGPLVRRFGEEWYKELEAFIANFAKS